MTFTSLSSTGDELVGKNLDGRYLIRAKIGAGGMGMVYRGLQVSVGRDVAIKVVHPSMLGDRNAARRFLREVSLAARLTSPHTVQVIDFGETPEGTLYLVMELLSGEPLDTELRRAARLAPRRVLELAIPIADALAAAHAANFVHRDLKPSNVFLARETSGHERVKVLDFGIARGFGASTLTGSGEVVGSPPYVAPEAIRGEPLDGRADLYSLGCMMFQLLTGAPPFLASSVAETFRLHLEAHAPPLPEQTPRALAAIVERLLHKAPAERFADATALRAALVAALREVDADPSSDLPAPPRAAPARDEGFEVSMTAATADTRDLGRPATPPRRGQSPVILGAIIFAVALAAAAITWRVWPRAPAPAPAAAASDAATRLPATPVGAGAIAPVHDDAPDAAITDAAAAVEATDARPRGASRPRDAGAPRSTADAAPVPPRRDAGVGFVLPR